MTNVNKVGQDNGVKIGNRGKGRPKGSKNIATKAIKDMILGALDDAGGQKYLLEQARNNPSAFLTLIGKVIPQDVNAKVLAAVLTPEQADRLVNGD